MDLTIINKKGEPEVIQVRYLSFMKCYILAGLGWAGMIYGGFFLIGILLTLGGI